MRELRAAPRWAFAGTRLGAPAVLGAATGAIGAAYGLLIPMGLPYDEPSHRDYVDYLVQHDSLPVLGDPGVTYEAQQGPVAYVGYALVARAARSLGASASAQVGAARLVGLAWLVMCVLLAFVVVRRALPELGEGTVGAAVAVAYLNPMVVADAASLQNDLPSMAFALLAVRWATRPGDGGLLPGLALGLALLSKLTAWPVAVVLAGWTWWQRSGRDAVVLVAAASAVFGWWPLRNALLYGDPTGAGAIPRAGVTFAPDGWHGVATPAHLARAAVTFVWIPVEYYRNTVRAPALVEVLVLAATVLVVLGAGVSYRRPTPQSLLLAVVAATAVAAWAVITTWVEGASFRIAYVGLPAWAVCAAGALRRLGPTAPAGSAVFLAALNAWTLYATVQR